MQINIRPLTKHDLETYYRNDWVLGKLSNLPRPLKSSDVWLEKIPAKRLMFDQLYHDLINSKSGKILDIGSGNTDLLPKVLSHLDVEFLDPAFEITNNQKFHRESWDRTLLLTNKFQYDVITCNDLFPNVDNRIFKFLELVLPLTLKLRMTLTAHSSEKLYHLRKTDGEELFWNAWDKDILLYKLTRFFNIDIANNAFFNLENSELFDDKRTVYLLEVSRE